MSIVYSGDKITFADSSVQSSAGIGFKNRIINGDMRIDQRNAGAAVTPTNGDLTLDRWKATLTVASKYSVQQSTVAPTGFANSALITSLSSYSVGASDYFLYQQRIEGYNTADLAWGTADAKTVTLSFWVRSSLTGTFGGSLFGGSSYSYPFSYTISSANTWEQKSITIVGATSGTWPTNNSTGITLYMNLGAGSTYSGTAGSWVSGTYFAPTGATSVVGTSGATFYITGVQLEVGSSASSFEVRDYGRELAMCQRYYFRKDIASGNAFAILQAYSTTAVYGKLCDLPVTMRATPTGTLSAIGSFNASNAAGSSSAVFTAGSVDNVSPTSIGTGSWGGSSGLVAGNASVISVTTSSWIAASAEL